MSGLTAAIVGGVAAVGGALISSNASQSAAQTQANAATTAANTQLQATEASNALQYQMYLQNQVNQQPYMQAGNTAMSAIMAGLGLTGSTAGNQVSPAGGLTNGYGYSNAPPSQGYATSNITPTSTGTAAPVAMQGASALATPLTAQQVAGTPVSTQPVGTPNPVLSGLGVSPASQGSTLAGKQNANGYGTPANTFGNQNAPVAAPATPATPTITTSTGQVINAPTTNVPGIGNVSPQNISGTAAQMAPVQNEYQNAFTQTFTPSMTNLSPAYQFNLQQGLQALQSSDIANGQLLTGQGAKDITNYAQSNAMNAYQQAYNNFMTNQSTLYNRLAGVAGLGQNAAAGVGNAGIQTGQGVANTTMQGTAASNNYLTSGAAAQAAGTVGSANAISGGLNSAANNYMSMNMMNQLMNNNVGYIQQGG